MPTVTAIASDRYSRGASVTSHVDRERIRRITSPDVKTERKTAINRNASGWLAKKLTPRSKPNPMAYFQDDHARIVSNVSQGKSASGIMNTAWFCSATIQIGRGSCRERG